LVGVGALALIGVGVYAFAHNRMNMYCAGTGPGAVLNKSVRAKPTVSAQMPCLCSFDVDRTLTEKQCDFKRCAKNRISGDITDTAYSLGGGTLTLSPAGQCLLPSFCVQQGCYIGIVTAGDASGYKSQERESLLEHFDACHGKLATREWCGPSLQKEARRSCEGVNITSPLVVGCKDGTKQYAVAGIVDWFQKTQHVTILPNNVWHFDDRKDNVEAFRSTGFNARQVSCKTRDYGGVVGLCGAEEDELKNEPGIVVCDS